MRRKVWVAVFGLLVLAVVAQSMVLVERRSSDHGWEYRVGSNGRLVKIKNSNGRRFAPEPSNLVVLDSELPESPAEIEKVRRSLKSRDALWSATVVSRPLPLSAADEDAMDKARTRITHELNLSHGLPREFIKNRMIADRRETPGPTVEGSETFVVNYDLKLTPDTWQLIAEDERNSRIKERMGILAALIAGATALCGCVAGYIRLDEATKGYYSGRLKVAAVVILVLAGSAIAAAVD